MNNKFNELKNLLENAYAPYSKFFVSAIAIPKENPSSSFLGVNVENTSFGATICGERSAISAMVTSGYRKIKELHLLTSSEKNTVFPCGICLQFISEFVTETSTFYIYNLNGEIDKLKFKDLMPYQIFKNKEIK